MHDYMVTLRNMSSKKNKPVGSQVFHGQVLGVTECQFLKIRALKVTAQVFPVILVTVFPLLTLLFSHDGKLFKHLYILSSFLGFFICRPLNWLIKMFRVLFLKSSLIFFLLIYLFYLYYFLLFSFGSLLSALTNCLGSSIICEKEEEEKGKEREGEKEKKRERERKSIWQGTAGSTSGLKEASSQQTDKSQALSHTKK